MPISEYLRVRSGEPWRTCSIRAKCYLKVDARVRKLLRMLAIYNNPLFILIIGIHYY